MRTRVAVIVGAAALITIAAGIALRAETPPADTAALAAQVAALSTEVAELRAAIAARDVAALANLDVPPAMTLFDQALPLDRAEVREALAYELVLTVGKPTMPLLWMRRAPALLPLIEGKLRERGMPDDLKYVPMIESDLRWTPESPAGAVGLWQFIARTGRRFGLAVDHTVDERMDPERSTDAALDYLAGLHREFGDWRLAAAAYNAGEALVRSAIADQGRRDYFDLYLPYETRRYVPRLLAAKLVYEHPEKYGLFRMTPLFEPKYGTVDVNSPHRSVDLREFARARGLDYAALRIHNPQVRGPVLPPGRHRLRVPTSGEKPPASSG